MSVVYLSFSGGLDSTTLLYHFLREGDEIRPVFFNYGSKHNPFEQICARSILVEKGLQLAVIDLSQTRIFANNDSALLSKNIREIPEDSYKEPGSLDATVVPGRNMIMASILASMAESEARRRRETAFVALAIHAGDHALYPDCRPGFGHFLAQAIDSGTEGYVKLCCPFNTSSKADIVAYGRELGVPFNMTRSCYKAQARPCGKCGTCRERIAAFEANGLEDPAIYAR